MADASAYSVGAMMSAMKVSDKIKTFIVSNQDLWDGFGKMDSHKYRAKLMKLMSSSKLTEDSKVMVFFLFSVVKKKSRVLDAMDGLDENTKAEAWFTPTRTFIATTIVDYNTQAKSASKFPGTHIPTTNPGLDILFYVMMTPEENRSLEELSRRPTFAQLHLDPKMQEVAKSGYKYYWESVVTSTKNTTVVEKPSYKEEYYNTSAGDKYYLIGADSKEIKPMDLNSGYSEKEIKDFLKMKFSSTK